MALSKAERLQKVHQTALREFNRTQSAQRDERLQCVSDRRFAYVPGAQWEGLEEQFANRPRYEVNKVYLSLMRIINEYRNNRISVDFVSKDGSKNDDLADVLDGLYRADEQDSNAEEAYDNAFDEGAAGGIGGWRLRACYENEDDDEDERQRIRFEPIYDADTSIWFDLDAKRADKADAKRGWVLYSQTQQDFIDEWDEDPATWPKGLTEGSLFDWCTPDVVYAAEYYEVEEKRETVHIYVTIDQDEVRYSDEELEDEDIQNEILLTQAVKVREKKIKRRRIHKYIMSGGGVLEDCGYIAGKHIPIVPYYGTRRFVDNIERCMGHTRLAKDPQRLKNMMLSWLAEIAAWSPLRKPLFTPEQVAGHEVMWANDNIENNPYLLLNPILNPDGTVAPAGAMGYMEPPDIPQALAALLQLTEQDMAELLGNQQQADKMVSNISAKAVELIQTRLDMQAFIYMSNFAKAMQRCGVIWLSMAKELYHEKGRRMKSVGEQGDVSGIVLGTEKYDKDGNLYDATDLSAADFDVVVDVGPSFTSRRDATVRALTGMMQMTQDPTDLKVLSSLAMMNMDGEGLTDVREFYRKQLVQMGALQPNDEELKAMNAAQEQEQPDPNAQYLLAAAQKEMAQAGKLAAETDETVADTAKAEAETAKILSEIGQASPV